MSRSLASVVIHPLEFITHQQSASMVAGSIQQEDKMCEVCENGGCTNCAPQNTELQFASGKEIEEFYDSYGESLWVDPAESTEDTSSSL
jgi:hypothetical protein